MKQSSILVVCLIALAVAVSPTTRAATIYETSLSGAAESPPNGSLGTGFARVTIDLDLLTMHVEANFTGLGGNTTAAHVHCCLVPAGPPNVGVATTVPTFPGFPLTVTAGSYDQSFDLTAATTFNPAFVTANGGTIASARTAFVAGLDAGATYFNIHTSTFGAGEIRGILHAVPEPQSLVLLAFGLGALGVAKRSRR